MARARLSAAKATGSAWKLPPERDVFILGKHQGCRGPRSPRTPAPPAAWRIWGQTGAHHLGLAAQGRDPAPSRGCGGTCRSRCHPSAGGGSRQPHRSVRTTYRVDAASKGRRLPKRRLHAHGTYGDGAGVEILGVEQTFQRKRRARLVPLSRASPFRRQRDGLQPGNLQAVAASISSPLWRALPSPYQQTAHVGQRRHRRRHRRSPSSAPQDRLRR